MSEAFDKLHPLVQHHVVNTLGWRELRPLQEASIEPVLGGSHALLLAPTAGGKTEAAILPLLSRMASDQWEPMSVLYLCPLKALLNNLHGRLERYCGWVGRSCGIWHGDVLTAQRKRVLADLPDCLLTTPESLEAMLISTRVEHRNVFANVRAVVIDELHAFAGDDRGWHLLAVLERVTRLAGRELQRIGLSATIGNPDRLLQWLAGHCEGPRQLVQIAPSTTAPAPEVQVDYVGSVENAARVIAALHAGQKRLVFCDSRSRVEQIALHLREAGVETYVSHSSLSAEERKRAEAAFAEGGSCVIVSTSTLELGIDVGDLDRVIQIDAPATVASFLQRIGRTGRRAGTVRNCLFLALSDDSLRHCVALVRLWQSGFVEPIQPPPYPIHLFSQQLLALILQERRVVASEWFGWIGRLPVFNEIPASSRAAVLGHLLAGGFVMDDQGLWSIGPTAESELGMRHFSELVSVFTSPPLYEVWSGRQHVGNVEETALHTAKEGPAVIALGGRAWRVIQQDWKKRRVEVVPEPGAAKTRWLGGARALGFDLCQMIRLVLTEDESYPFLSRRARECLEQQRDEFAWVGLDGPLLQSKDGKTTEWWTFAGRGVNRWICDALEHRVPGGLQPDDFKVRVGAKPEDIRNHIRFLASAPEARPGDDASESVKFSELLPAPEIARLRELRTYPQSAVSRFCRTLSQLAES